MAGRTRRKPGVTRVLVVDDEPGTVEVLQMVLADAGYRASGAGNGREALAALPSESPDVVLLDIVMPVMDGPEALRALRSDARWAKLPVITMSGLPESVAKRRCPGADAFLRKPFSLDELITAVRVAASTKGIAR